MCVPNRKTSNKNWYMKTFSNQISLVYASILLHHVQVQFCTQWPLILYRSLRVRSVTERHKSDNQWGRISYSLHSQGHYIRHEIVMTWKSLKSLSDSHQLLSQDFRGNKNRFQTDKLKPEMWFFFHSVWSRHDPTDSPLAGLPYLSRAGSLKLLLSLGTVTSVVAVIGLPLLSTVMVVVVTIELSRSCSSKHWQLTCYSLYTIMTVKCITILINENLISNQVSQKEKKRFLYFINIQMTKPIHVQSIDVNMCSVVASILQYMKTCREVFL